MIKTNYIKKRIKDGKAVELVVSRKELNDILIENGKPLTVKKDGKMLPVDEVLLSNTPIRVKAKKKSKKKDEVVVEIKDEKKDEVEVEIKDEKKDEVVVEIKDEK